MSREEEHERDVASGSDDDDDVQCRSLLGRLLSSPEAVQALGQALAPVISRVNPYPGGYSGQSGEQESETRGRSSDACAQSQHVVPGNAADQGTLNPHAGRGAPNMLNATQHVMFGVQNSVQGTPNAGSGPSLNVPTASMPPLYYVNYNPPFTAQLQPNAGQCQITAGQLQPTAGQIQPNAGLPQGMTPCPMLYTIPLDLVELPTRPLSTTTSPSVTQCCDT